MFSLANFKTWEGAGKIVLLLVFGAFMWWKGYEPQHDKYVAYQAQVEQAQQVQQAKTDATNKQLEENAKHAETKYALAMSELNSLRHDKSSSSTVPQAPSSSKDSDATASEWDASTFTPNECRQVAGILALLQDLLREDGVQTK